MQYLILFIFLCANLFYVSCESKCLTFKTCGGCIGYAYDTCVWCSAKNIDESRCQSKSYHEQNPSWCNEAIYDPQTDSIPTTNENFNAGEDGSKIVQFRPQEMKIRVRPGVPVNITMSYKPAKDYPLDIYYLMDYSYSMTDHVKALKEQGNKIYQQLIKLTNNVQLGIGSFIEKPAFPFVEVGKHYAYSFKNHLPLTDNMTLFMEILDEKLIGANYDVPEAGFDALMQAMVCKDEIGWRNDSRKIIVYSTDSTYHSAGDGKFVGAFEPNDMKCHLVNNSYSMALVLDYPSVSQINKVANENNFKIIYSIAKEQRNIEYHYIALEKKIQGSKYVPLDKNSQLVDMIKNEYLDLIRNLKIKANIPNFMQLTFDPDCKKGGCVIKHNESITINGTLLVKSCVPKAILEVGPVSLSEKLLIEVETNCQCECENPGQGEENSKMCSGSGTYQCGYCKCNKNRYGTNCRCTGSNTDTADFNLCKANKNDTYPCNNRGTCRCGKCEDCKKGFSGDYCEFSDAACETSDRQLCSGRGSCQYGRCQCGSLWRGDFCECPNHEKNCIAPNSKEVCSNNGICNCGVCECFASSSKNTSCSGKYCDDCEEYAEKRCKELEDFAFCNLEEEKSECENKYNFTDTDVVFVNKTEFKSPMQFIVKTWCSKVLDDGRTFVFKYYYNTTSINFIIQKELDEPSVANLWVAVGSVVGTVLLIGLLTLIAWKVLVDLYDKREYEKFEESVAAEFPEIVRNVLYQPPAVNYSNPAYRNRWSERNNANK